ncbi:uncharacterized protein LOC119718904 [Patiria miniata]|uniref:Uncharacterized protein n=1 Tax=Patiria miniata TaxID=46514 RepID=A0A913Z0R4_PATMI|nr:uncharacterized protein LOC119718904 [Patiria miniata]
MSSKKMKMIQPRPEPPGLDSVRSDLEKAPNDDVVFTFFKSVLNDDQTETSTKASLPRSQHVESSSDVLKSSLASELSSAVPTKQRSQDLDHCYKQTLEFIQMNEYLKDSQDTLADQATELQRLGQAIKEQVESLRTQLS